MYRRLGLSVVGGSVLLIVLGGCSKPNALVGSWSSDITQNLVPMHMDLHIAADGSYTENMAAQRLFDSLGMQSTGTWKMLGSDKVELRAAKLVISEGGTQTEAAHPTAETINIISVSDTEMFTSSSASGMNFQIPWKRISRD
jgi:hypothetical protein